MCQNDVISRPLIIDLQKMKLFAGDKIRIEIEGKYHFDVGRPSEMINDTAAVFSSSNVLLAQSELKRVPGAIDCGIDFTTDVTWHGKHVTDIPEDFDARGADVIIPKGAKYLFIGVTDGFVTDNTADKSFKAKIIRK